MVTVVCCLNSIYELCMALQTVSSSASVVYSYIWMTRKVRQYHRCFFYFFINRIYIPFLTYRHMKIKLDTVSVLNELLVYFND